MKRQDKLTEREEREAWKKIPKRPQRHTEATTDFDEAHLYASDEGVDADAVSHGLTRDEAAARLQEQGLSKSDRALVLGSVFDGLSTRKLEAVTGWKKSRVAQKLKSPTIKRAIADLRSGKARPGNPQATTQPSGQSYDLQRCAAEAQRCCKLFGFPEYGLDDWLKQGEPERPLAWRYTTAIRRRPATLLAPKYGRRCAKVLVDLLEAATLGDCKRRVRGVVPEGTRKEIMEAARAALANLTGPQGGQPYQFEAGLLAYPIQRYQDRLAELRREWRALAESVPAIEKRLEILKARHGKELSGFEKRELQSILTGDPVNTLDTACRLAEKVTHLTAEVWKRHWRDWEKHREAVLRLNCAPL